MLTKDNTYKVAKLFFDFPEREFHIRELARLTKLSAPAIIKLTKKLEKTGIITIENGKLSKCIKASRSHVFLAKKQLYNIDALFSSGLVDFLQDIYEEPEAIILFGSYSRGEDISKSDVDIAVITKKRMNLNFDKFEKFLNRKINVMELQIKECEKELLNNLLNGIVLYGYFKVL
ncbi:MAG: nucleotidyltransferase domain-containing protein [Candidatus Aenigmarchaeota archaeon]|nr:nucleotidyltransferase domain-containing protein [Candidatus Aenigmarchaeota archaeon]